ncbi:MAG TPA: hypothetical protein VLX61_12620 [Anaerolineales bacterium]|nr:hypothetical protein [Anaerolineales bacterium]
MIEQSEFTLPIKMTVHWVTRIIFIFSIILFGAFAILSLLSDHDVFTSSIFLVFALLSVYTFIASQSTIEINQDSITLSSPPHGEYRMYWGEVRSVETNGATFAFVGDDRHLAISLVFVGNRKQEFLSFLNDFLEKQQLNVNPLSSMYLRQKNTKVG